MYALIRSSSLRELLATQVPAVTVSLVIAELFYKFHSFTLECVAFLATWLVIDLAVGGLRSVVSGFRRVETGRGAR